MTTGIRVQHMDSAYEVDVEVVSQVGGFNPGEIPEFKVSQTIRLAGKGDETLIYVHSGQSLTVREVPLQVKPATA